MTSSQHVYEVRPRRDHRGVDLISDVLPFGRRTTDFRSFRPSLTGIPLESVLIAGRQMIRLREHSVSLNRADTVPHPPPADGVEAPFILVAFRRFAQF
jgi:hypothetical protein